MAHTEVFLVVLTAIVSYSTGQFPPECSCPDSCVCSARDSTINCVNQRLAYVPVELNSCSWPGIKKIDLSGNRIEFVHELAFSLLVDITHLYLYDNLIEDIDRSAFIGLDSLEYLFLDGNRLERLPYNVFHPLRQLKKLLLYNNLLTALPLGIFQNQRLLTHLALYDNRLNRLLTEVFDDTPLLKELYLHQNQISDLSGVPFRSLRQLSILYLNENRLTRLTRFDFIGLNLVSQLLLNDNQISTIDNEAFVPTQSLQFLYLENNRITSINVLVFAGPVQLLHLRVFNNKIERISNGAFFRLRKLQRLSLYNNEITHISHQTFVGLDSLTQLTLYNNRIRSIENGTFIQCPLLEQLWFYNNELSCIEEGAFKGLNNLQLLQLGQNRLSYLPQDVFSYTPALNYLLLYANEFRSIETRPFRNLFKLVQLSLFANSIHYITEGTFDDSGNIFYFEWSVPGSPNSLVCDCSALWFYQWITSKSLQASVICASPPEFEGQDIRSLKAASFGCSAGNLRVSIDSDDTEHVVANGNCLRLLCSSSPRGPVQWSRIDGRPIPPLTESCVGVSPCAEGTRGSGVLVVESVRSDDAGFYMCTASFQNQTAAMVRQVVIGTPPIILEEPDDIVLPHPGGMARLNLNFTGSPWPEVSWFQVSPLSDSLIPLVETHSGSRYIIGQNGTLYIPTSSLEDEGTYRALLHNGAGEMSVDVQLSFMFETSCHSSCFNDGSCTQVSVCVCPAHFEGRRCEDYVEPTEAPLTSSSSPILTTPMTLPPSDDPGSGQGPSTDPDSHDDTTAPTKCSKSSSDSNCVISTSLVDDEDYSTKGTTEQELDMYGSGMEYTNDPTSGEPTNRLSTEDEGVVVTSPPVEVVTTGSVTTLTAAATSPPTEDKTPVDEVTEDYAPVTMMEQEPGSSGSGMDHHVAAMTTDGLMDDEDYSRLPTEVMTEQERDMSDSTMEYTSDHTITSSPGTVDGTTKDEDYVVTTTSSPVEPGSGVTEQEPGSSGSGMDHNVAAMTTDGLMDDEDYSRLPTEVMTEQERDMYDSTMEYTSDHTSPSTGYTTEDEDYVVTTSLPVEAVTTGSGVTEPEPGSSGSGVATDGLMDDEDYETRSGTMDHDNEPSVGLSRTRRHLEKYDSDFKLGVVFNKTMPMKQIDSLKSKQDFMKATPPRSGSNSFQSLLREILKEKEIFEEKVKFATARAALVKRGVAKRRKRRERGSGGGRDRGRYGEGGGHGLKLKEGEKLFALVHEYQETETNYPTSSEMHKV